jgi:hypothetical protein
MTATDSVTTDSVQRRPSLLRRLWQRRRSRRRQIDYAVWDLRERYGEAAYGIARNSARQPIGLERRRFWRKVAMRLRQLG